MKTKDRVIYLPLMGRIGNQLFQYSFAYALQREIGDGTKILIDDFDVTSVDWINSLVNYSLPNVEYIHGRDKAVSKTLGSSILAFKLYSRFVDTDDAKKLAKREVLLQKLFNRMGLIAILRGYQSYSINPYKNIFLYGYFQSENYFVKYRDELKKLFDKSHELRECNYPFLEELEKRNSVCISIKIEHNLSSPIYDVCGEDYYRRAIAYIEEKVENPLFFLCSDNVEKAKALFGENIKTDIVCQPGGYDVSLTLSAMSKCKHFVINNTSFGWWAQYLSGNKEKIVVAPARWKKNDDPVSIYDNQVSWHLI